MSDEQETNLPQDSLKQAEDGEAAVQELSPEELNKVAGGNLAADVLNGAMNAGKVKMQDFNFVRSVDAASPKLYE